MAFVIPLQCGALDVETKGTEFDAYVLSISGAMYSVLTLKPVACMNANIDPNDPEQAHRSTSDHTMEWWSEAGQKNRPSILARTIAFSGNNSTKAGLSVLKKFLDGLPKQRGSYTIAMKGPDFDYPILKTLLKDLDVKYVKLYGGDLDSSRTIERMFAMFDFPPIGPNEFRTNVVRHGPSDEHISSVDAAIEAYSAARLYHLGYLTLTKGREYALEQIKSWEEGNDPIPLEYEYNEETYQKVWSPLY